MLSRLELSCHSSRSNSRSDWNHCMPDSCVYRYVWMCEGAMILSVAFRSSYIAPDLTLESNSRGIYNTSYSLLLSVAL